MHLINVLFVFFTANGLTLKLPRSFTLLEPPRSRPIFTSTYPTFSYQTSSLKALTSDGFGSESLKALTSDGFGSENIARPGVVIGGTLAAYLLRSFPLPSPLSAPIILGLISTLLIFLELPIAKYQPSLYCGAFAGTTCLSLMSSPINALILGAITASLFEVFERKFLFSGKGGRLGMCATLSGTIFAAVKGKVNLRVECLEVLSKIALMAPTAFLAATRSAAEAFILPFIFASLGAITCTLFRRRRWLPVSASSAVGAVGVYGLGGELGAFVYAGSFIGMSSDAEKTDLKRQVVAAGFLTLFFQVLGKNFLGKVGGKLGAAALLGVLVRDKMEK